MTFQPGEQAFHVFHYCRVIKLIDTAAELDAGFWLLAVVRYDFDGETRTVRVAELQKLTGAHYPCGCSISLFFGCLCCNGSRRAERFARDTRRKTAVEKRRLLEHIAHERGLW